MAITKFGLPVLQRVNLTAFSLYTERPQVDLQIPDGVFCLVGANGIGKSTFIAAVNFGLCGRLPKPGERFRSSDEYFQNVSDFSSDFFDGRINEFDREKARIEIEFTVKKDKYHIVRGAFEPNQLRYASVNGNDLTGSPTSINDAYKQSMSESVGVANFEQFVFLQLFVFTFDEQRNLTFWETPVQRQILLLAFGDDAGEAQEAEDLRRKIERLDSIARNANYQANENRKRLQAAQHVLGGLGPEALDLREELEHMELELDKLSAEETDALESLSDSKLRSAELRSKSLVLKEKIDSIFVERAVRTANIGNRPIIAESLASASCHLCGASGAKVIEGIEQKILECICPICGIDLPPDEFAEDAMQAIVDVDKELSDTNRLIHEETHKQQRTQIEIAQVQASIAQQQRRISEFEKENRALTKSIGTTVVSDLRESIQANERVIRDLNTVKRNARRDRDEAMDRLKQIQSRVSQQYADAEREFLAIFKNLAESFIGLDLDIRFDVRGTDIFLVLAIEGRARRRQFQLSESQRFFVDIALRMAIVTFSASDGKGILLVDTPEGSLDIAYESRAGEMFARFVGNGYQLMMTANINTSRLLRELAKRCGTGGMYLERMTEWTTLSEVQESAQHLFEEAFVQIESDLRGVAP